MKFKILSSLFLTLTISADALAADVACNGTRQVNYEQTSSLLNNKMVCVGSSPNFEAQEFHSPVPATDQEAALIDYKRGPAAQGNIDPTEQVGTWKIDAQGKVTYIYGNSSFINDVYANGANVCFYNGQDTIIGTLKDTNGSVVSCGP